MLFVFVSNMLFGIKDCEPTIGENGRASIVCSRLSDVLNNAMKEVDACWSQKTTRGVLPHLVVDLKILDTHGYPIITVPIVCAIF